MGPLFTSKNKEKLVAIFDVGSGSVGGALVKISEDNSKNPVIIHSTRTEIVFHKELEFKALLDDMSNALKQTADNLYQSKSGAPKEVFCFLSSPWYISESRVIKMERKDNFVFTRRFADELVKREIDSLRTLYQKKFDKTKSDPELIENQITSVLLNGYHTEDPINKKTKKVEMNMIVSLSPEICVSRVRETISKTFHHTPVRFSSFINSAYIGIQDRYISAKSYVLMDIGGEITDIAIVSNGILEHSVSFPFGRRTFYRFLAEKLGKDLNEIQSLFQMYSSGTLEKKYKDKMDLSLSSISNSWGHGFKESIASLPIKKIIIPETIFLITNPDILKWFSQVIQTEEYVKSMTIEEKCNVFNLEKSNFQDVCDVRDPSCDPFLMVEAISVSRKQNI